MFGLDFDYLLFSFGLMLTFYVCGHKISRGYSALAIDENNRCVETLNFVSRHKYWTWAIPCFILFVLYFGLRYGRGNDYLHYIAVYKYDLEKSQLVFTSFNNLLKSFAIPPYGIFIFYAIPFILCALIFLRTYSKYAASLFPLFIVAFTAIEEYTIRQGLSFSFVFIFLYYLFQTKGLFQRKNIPLYVMMSLSFFLAYSIHSANAIVMIFMALIFILLKKPVPLKLSIPLFLFFTYFVSSITNLSFLENIIEFVGEQDEKFRQYVDHADDWFYGQNAYRETYSRNIFVKQIENFSNCVLIYFGYRALAFEKNDCRLISVYNIYVIGAILMQGFINYEALNRVFRFLYAFWCFPFAFYVFHSKKMKITKSTYFLAASLLFWFYDFGKLLFFRNGNTMFLWDVF